MSEPTCSADVQRSLAEAQTAAMNQATAALEAVAEEEAVIAMAVFEAEEEQDQ